MIMTNVFRVRPGQKAIVFVRTDTGRLFKISNRKIKTDGHIDENNGLIRKAVHEDDSYVAELYARFGVYPKRVEGRASSVRSRRHPTTSLPKTGGDYRHCRRLKTGKTLLLRRTRREGRHSKTSDGRQWIVGTCRM
jgi:hypothetical protein